MKLFEPRRVARNAGWSSLRSSAERGRDRGQRGVGLGAVRPAGLRHVGPAAAALAAQHLGGLAHQIDRGEPRDEIGRDADDDARPCRLRWSPTSATTPEPSCFLPSSARLFRSLMSMPSTARAISLTSPTMRTPFASPPALRAAAHRELLLRLGEFALELAALVEQRGEARRHLFERRLQSRRPHSSRSRSRGSRPCAPPCRSALRCGARPPRRPRRSRPRSARCRRCGAHACRRTARPTSRACCRRLLAHRDDAHLVAVFFAEQRARAGGACVVERHQARRDRRILQHEIVGDVLDLLDLLGASWAWDARSRSAAGRARPASPSARRDRRAPGAAPRAADASPNGWRGSAPRRA